MLIKILKTADIFPLKDDFETLGSFCAERRNRRTQLISFRELIKFFSIDPEPSLFLDSIHAEIRDNKLEVNRHVSKNEKYTFA